MRNFTYFLILSMSLAVVHLTNAGIIADRLVRKVELRYQVPPQFGGGEIPLNEVEKFHHDRPMALLCHGYIAHPTHDSIIPVLHGLMSTGDYNVVVVDWNGAAKLPYPQAKGVIGAVGRRVYEIVVENLENLNITFANIICIGHSLGAHVCGNLGKESNGELEKIYGLDPAAPLISIDAPYCLQKDDAKRVINIHTGAFLFGIFEPLGDVDIYSHYGMINQKGCTDPSSIADFFTKANACSHNRACQIAGEGIASKLSFPCIPCDIEAIRKKSPSKCQNNRENKISRSTLQNEIANQIINGHIIYANLDIPEDVNGTYIMETYARPPFGKGVGYEVPHDYA